MNTMNCTVNKIIKCHRFVDCCCLLENILKYNLKGLSRLLSPNDSPTSLNNLHKERFEDPPRKKNIRSPRSKIRVYRILDLLTFF